jgi:hypothetical protein
MLRSLGKLLQVAGLVILPAAMVMQLTSALRTHSISVMLLLMVFGAAIFGLGRILEAYGR